MAYAAPSSQDASGRANSKVLAPAPLSVVRSRPTTLVTCRPYATAGHGSNDPYEVLGVDRRASKQQIVDAYHALALRWHPDRNPSDPEAEDRFKQVSAAYRTLRHADNAGSAAQGFAHTAGISREEADQLFREVFGADTLDEMAAVLRLLDCIQQRVQDQIRDKHPLAEHAVQQLAVNGSGALVVRTTVRLGCGREEVHDHEVTAEEAAELAQVGLGVVRIAGLAARDVAARVAVDVSQGIAQGVLDALAGGVHAASQLVSPLVPNFLPGQDKGEQPAAARRGSGDNPAP